MDDKKKTPYKPVWLEKAEGEIGVTEIPGPKHNPRILEYHKCTTLNAQSDEIAYCSAFINWVFKQCGFPTTNSALARSWLDWGIEITRPRIGCVTIFKRGKYSWQGHVGLYLGENDTHIRLLGANQNNKVCIKLYKKEDLLGYRWPEKLPYTTDETLLIKETLRHMTRICDITNSDKIDINGLINKITYNWNME